MASYIDGRYEGTSRGIGGRVDVAVTIEDGVLTNVELTRLKETSGIGQEAGPIVAQAILDAGGTDVDIVSGATVTSSAIILAADQALRAAEGGYNDGTYSGTARGIGGRVDVEATFEDGQLVDLVLTRLKETSGIGQVAGPVVLQEILDSKSTNVDIMTGATVTSSAVILAAQMAFDKASGAQFKTDYEAEQEKASA